MGMLTGDFYSEQLKMTTQIRVLIPDVSNDVTPLFDGEEIHEKLGKIFQ